MLLIVLHILCGYLNYFDSHTEYGYVASISANHMSINIMQQDLFLYAYQEFGLTRFKLYNIIYIYNK